MAERARQNYNKNHNLKIQAPQDDIGTYVNKKVKESDFLANLIHKLKLF